MNWINGILKYYGFQKPHNFPAALLVLANLLLLVVVGLTGVYWAMKSQLGVGSPRFYFFLYLSVTLLLSTLLSRVYRLSLFLLCLCLIDFGLATFSSFTYNLGLGADLLPQNVVQLRSYDYHPLLQGIPKTNFSANESILYRQERVLVRHNSDGLRGEEIGDLDPTVKLVFAYGGSTAYDLGVDQGKTWVEQLQKKLGNGYAVLNFGVPGYSTQEHVIQTAFYGDYKGRLPVCSLYYVGWNDIRNAHIPDLDRGYADFHALTQLGSLQIRDSRIDFTKFSPLLSIIVRYTQAETDVVPLPPDLSALSFESGPDPNLEKIYLNNISTLTAINNSRSVRSVFIGQILNRARLTADSAYGWLPLVKDKHVWHLQNHFNEVLKARAEELGSKYIGLDINTFDNEDFVDNGHFSETGAKKFAESIYPQVFQACH